VVEADADDGRDLAEPCDGAWPPMIYGFRSDGACPAATASMRLRFAVFPIVITALVACSAAPAPTITKSSDATEKGDDHDHDGEAGVYPTEVFTGFDGARDFVVPVSAHGGKATWTAEDEDIVELTPRAEGVEIKSKKAGTTKVTAKIGGKSFSVKVTVKAYPKDAWSAGNAVYNETVRCASCHLKANGPDHSPSEVGRHEDEHLERRILTGESLHGEAKQPNHAFEDQLQANELEGVVAYLRALEPNGWPKEAHDHE
jgi:mono/diheme cytochrome c family protein